MYGRETKKEKKGAFMKANKFLWILIIVLSILMIGCFESKTGPKIQTATVTINFYFSSPGATVILENHNGVNTYERTAASSSVVFTDIPFGTYTVLLNRIGRDPYIYNSLSVQAQTIIHNIYPNVGDIIAFGSYDWRVLDVQDGRVFVISQNIIERRVYHTSSTSITWENCSLRAYLNGGFYNSFSEADRARIVQVTNTNPNNPDYGTNGGNDTLDRIFLLSLGEAESYFTSNADRVALYNGSASWWWLRSPGTVLSMRATSAVLVASA